MTSFYAKSPAPDVLRRVVFVVYDDIVLLDLVGPLQVFTHAHQGVNAPNAYQTQVVSLNGGRIETNTILSIDSDPLAGWMQAHPDTAIHTLVVVGGDGAPVAALDPVLVAQVAGLAQRSLRVCSVCSGAFVLAAAGLLDGRRAVTHWEDCDALAAQFPAVQVEVDPIYVKDDSTPGDGPEAVWTSAGITAGIDMALAIVEEDLGHAAAIDMARSLVVPMVRAGGQSQFSPTLDRQARDTKGRFTALHRWLNAHMARPIGVADMAAQCGMSARNFSRQYSATMGTPPARALEAIRVAAARDLLDTTRKGIKTIAAQCGFQDDERMRRAFLRQIKTTPSQYRAQFRADLSRT